MSKLIGTKFGLLMERATMPNETVSLPILFFLSHPHKDIGPVIFKPILSNDASLCYISLFHKLELVFFDKETNFCLFYHKVDGTHSVWRLRKAEEFEIDMMTCNSTQINNSRLECDGRSVSFTESPLFTSRRQSTNQTPMMNTSIASPYINAIKNSNASISMISPAKCTLNNDKSFSGSPHYISPLRTTRLAASPISPLRAYPTPTTSKVKPGSASKSKIFSTPLDRLSTPNRSTQSVDFMNDIDTPILLDVCIEHIWSEPAHGLTGKTRKAFITVDCTGQNYMAYLLGQQQQLKLIRFDPTNDGMKIIFGPLNLISAKDAEPIESLSMMCVLDHANNIILYTGTTKVSTVHVPSLLTPTSGLLGSPSSSKSFSSPVLSRRRDLSSSTCPSSSQGHQPRFSAESELSPVLHDQSQSSVYDADSSMSSFSYKSISNILSIKDNVHNRITVETNHSINFRINLPPIATSDVVKMCLKSLKSVLPPPVATQLVVRWYSLRNSPASYEYTPEKELDLFKYSLLSFIGYDLDTNVFDMDYYSNISPSLPKKLKMDTDERGSDDDWHWLLSNSPSSAKKALVRRSSSDVSRTISSSSSIFPHLPSVLFTLHLIHEELLLDLLLKDFAPQLCDIIYMIANDLKLISYQDYYWRMAPNICSSLNYPSRISQKDSKLLNRPSYLTDSPPIVYNHLQSLLNHNGMLFPCIPGVTLQIRRLVLIFSCFQHQSFSESDVLTQISWARQELGKEIEVSAGSPHEKIVLCLNKLKMTQNDLKCIPSGVVLPIWSAIFKCKPDPPITWDSECYSLIGREDLAILSGSKVPKYPLQVDKILEIDNDDDGLSSLNREALSLIFPDDRRIDEAYEFLQSSKPVIIAIQQKPGVSDQDFIEDQERHLYTTNIRTCALPIGRGMLTLRTFKPVVAKTFPIPKLCLSGRVPQRNLTVEVSHIDVPQPMNTWPFFHNGVAAGLKVCPNTEAIDSHWIIYNKTKAESASNPSNASDSANEHAGFLFALGLNGYLPRLSLMNIHDYLQKGNELSRVAILLGLAAARRGTMDISIERMLSIHAEAFLPPSPIEIDIPPVVEVAAVLGVGLLYQGSGQRHIAEKLLAEIGRPPGPEMEHYLDRESYALSAGLALGLVTLGRGNELISVVSSAESSSMADELCNYMIGGHKRPLNAAQREKYRTPSYQIREGDCVNSDVTSPGATLALGMMFFSTNNEAIAKWVTAPDTQYLLESVRPDFLLLRTLAKGLIMWDSIKATKEWIDSHLPSIVAENALVKEVDHDSRIDNETMSQAFCNIIAGACMAMGLKYAGTANQEAFDSIYTFVNLFINLPNDQILVEQAGRSTIESCLNVLITSLAMIMAGTGNKLVMRICRYLRSRILQINVVLYGSHMATHMALGLLFLGGCRYTLSTSPEAIAALICAFFPKYPIHCNDNRYHLQAFRHLYVLAAEPRLVLPRDIDTGKLVYAYLLVKKKPCEDHPNGEIITIRAPGFLPQLESIEEVTLQNDRYWKISFKRHLNWSNLTLVFLFTLANRLIFLYSILRSMLDRDGILYIKQKVGCLPYKEDPKGYKSIHAQCIMKDAVRGVNYKPDMLTSFSSNPLVTNYARYLLTPKSRVATEALFQSNLALVLFHCASNETVDCIPSIMHFLKIINECEKVTPFHLIQVRLLEHCHPKCGFVKLDFLKPLKALVESSLKGLLPNN